MTRPPLLLAVLLVAACSSGESRRPREASPGHRVDARTAATAPLDATACPPPAQLVPTAGRFDCVADADCVTTCSWGAINRAAATRLADSCDDGCANQIAAAPRCEAGRCVAYQDRGQGAVRDDYCTEKPAPDVVCEVVPAPPVDAGAIACPSPRRLVSTAGRFACAADADCVNTCAWGAINVATRAQLVGDCKDGCAAKISAPPRCQVGRCVAYRHRGDAVVADAECTDRPAPDPICIP